MPSSHATDGQSVADDAVGVTKLGCKPTLV